MANETEKSRFNEKIGLLLWLLNAALVVGAAWLAPAALLRQHDVLPGVWLLAGAVWLVVLGRWPAYVAVSPWDALFFALAALAFVAGALLAALLWYASHFMQGKH